MEVSLLSYTPDPERVVAVAARLCYSSLDAQQLNDNFTDEHVISLIKKLKMSKHMSAFEHVSFTFAISGLSRACTHQLVRHRLASYNQQSQRYVKFDYETMQSVIPQSVFDDEEALATFYDALKHCTSAYRKLLDLNIPAEDARYILPNAATSNIVVTMNARELLHFFSLRCCNRAQWEIRDLAWEMLKLCVNIAPTIFKDAGPECIRGHCAESKMSCGNPYTSFPF